MSFVPLSRRGVDRGHPEKLGRVEDRPLHILLEEGGPQEAQWTESKSSDK